MIVRVVRYYNYAVKVKRSIKNKSNMRTATSSDFVSCRLAKEVEEQLSNSGDFLYQAIENADGVPYHLVFGLEVGDGYYLNVGNGIQNLLGLNPGEFNEAVFLQMIEEIIPCCSDIPHNPMELRNKILRGELQKYIAEILVVTPAGDRRWIKDSSVPVLDKESGRITGLFGVFFDITAQKQTLSHLDKAMERASESDRLKTAFLNNLSHEIRTPLNAIVGFSTLLGESGLVPGSNFDYKEIITHSSDHLLEIVDDVVEISKIEAKVVRMIKKEVNLNQMLQRVYDRFTPAANEKKLLLRYDARMDADDIIIFTDGYKLFQSLNNLPQQCG